MKFNNKFSCFEMKPVNTTMSFWIGNTWLILLTFIWFSIMMYLEPVLPPIFVTILDKQLIVSSLKGVDTLAASTD